VTKSFSCPADSQKPTEADDYETLLPILLNLYPGIVRFQRAKRHVSEASVPLTVIFCRALQRNYGGHPKRIFFPVASHSNRLGGQPNVAKETFPVSREQRILFIGFA
jgi:hypothetical protein